MQKESKKQTADKETLLSPLERDQYFGYRENAPLSCSPILNTRLGLAYGENYRRDYARNKCLTLYDLKTDKCVGKTQRIPLSSVRKYAEGYMKNTGATSGLSASEISVGIEALENIVKKEREDLRNDFHEAYPDEVVPLLIQEAAEISELDFLLFNIKNAAALTTVLRYAVLGDIQESQALEKRWHKIKKYIHRVSLEKAYGGVFSENDAGILRNHGIKFLNDIRKHDIYELKNMFLEVDYSTLPEEINAAFKEDLERRKDFRYKVYPFIFGTLAMLFVAVVGFMYKYTLLKNRMMTFFNFCALGLWLITVYCIIYGAIRAKRRRRTKRPDYYYFTKRVKIVFIAFIALSVFSIGELSFFYERYDGYDDKVYYRNLKNNEITIAGLVDKDALQLDIPVSVDGKMVVNVSSYAFYGEKIIDVAIPQTVTAIEHSAFKKCKNLNAIAIPEGVMAIPDSMFEGCVSLNDVRLHEGITSIGKYAFKKCAALSDMYLPQSLTAINDEAFRECFGLRNFYMAGSVERIGKKAFMDCKSLVSVSVIDTSKLTRIENETFSGCVALSNFNILQDAVSIGDAAFKNCESIYELTLDSAVTEIGNKVFYGCKNLRMLSVPFLGKKSDSNGKYGYLFDKNSPVETLNITGGTEIANNAFKDCKTIKTVYLSDTITKIGESAFRNCPALDYVRLPLGLSEIKTRTFSDCGNLTSLGNFDSVSTVGNSAFYNCSAFDEQITNLSNLVSVGEKAFFNCKSLSNALLFNIESLGKSAFEGAGGLQHVNFGDRPGVIPENAFKDCGALKSVSGTENVSEIKKRAFYNCEMLSDVRFSANLTRLGEQAFAKCTSLKTAVIPDSVTKIDKNVFADCRLETISLPFIGNDRKSTGKALSYITNCNSLADDITVYITDSEKISKNSFKNCSAVKNVILNDKVTQIDGEAFADAKGLTTVVLPDAIAVIKKGTFKNCGNLVRVYGGSEITTIEENAFKDCGNLESADFANVRIIGKSAFGGCKSLISLGELSELTEVGENAFNACNSYETLRLPAMTEIGKRAFAGGGFKSVILSERIEKIDEEAFMSCKQMAYINFPSSLTFIGNSAFKSSGLTSVDLSYTQNAVFGKSVFEGATELSSVILPYNITEIPEGFFKTTISLKGISLPDGLTTIGKSAFYASNLENVDFPQSLNTIGESAFEACDSIKSITIPDSVEKINKNAFRRCASLNTFTAPFLGASRKNTTNGYRHLFDNSDVDSIRITDLEKIESKTFHGGEDHISSVSLGVGVKEIANNSFKGYVQLMSISLPDSLEKIGNSAFERCTSLKVVAIPDSVKTIGAYCFKGCRALSNVRLPYGLTEIAKSMFQDCSGLDRIMLPDSIKTVKAEAFRKSGIESVYFSSELKKIETKAFYNCSSLTSVNLPAGLEEINSEVFKDCGSLVSATVPNSVKKMDGSIFHGCRKLQELTLPYLGNKPGSAKGLSHFVSNKSFFDRESRADLSLTLTNATKIAGSAFKDYEFLKNLTLNNGISEIGKDAFKNCGLLTVYMPYSMSDYEDMLPSRTGVVYY